MTSISHTMAWPSEHSVAAAPFSLVPHRPHVCFRPQQFVCKQVTVLEGDKTTL